MRNLLWKEWHEQSWKMAFGCLVLGALALIGLHSRIISDQTMMMWVCFLGLSLLPVLSSTGLIPAERAEGSFESLLAMPIAPWRILFAKTAIGLLLCAGPMLVGGVISWLATGGREMSNQELLDLYGRSTLAAISLFLWMLILTSRLPSEARAGLIALGVLILWLLATTGLAANGVSPILFAISPFSFVYGFANSFEQHSPSLAIVFLLQIVILLPLWALTLRFFIKPIDATD